MLTEPTSFFISPFPTLTPSPICTFAALINTSLIWPTGAAPLLSLTVTLMPPAQQGGENRDSAAQAHLGLYSYSSKYTGPGIDRIVFIQDKKHSERHNFMEMKHAAEHRVNDIQHHQVFRWALLQKGRSVGIYPPEYPKYSSLSQMMR